MGENEQTHIEEFRSLLDRFGVADDLDWLSLILFVRNLVAHLSIYPARKKSEIQRTVLDTVAQKDLSRESFQTLLEHVEVFILQNEATMDLQRALDNEKRASVALVDEMNSLFDALRGSRVRQEQSINRFGKQTEEVVEQSGNKADIIKRVRGLLTEMVTEFREEARNWEEKARSLERTANYDGLLIELFNRRSLDAYMDDAVVEAQSRKTPLSLMMIDVDHFKAVNDEHGHPVGDDMLRALGKIVSSHAKRFEGYAARYGGEELAVVCPLTADRAVAEAENMRIDVASYDFVARKGGKVGEPVNFTVSIGVAQLAPGWDADRLVESADKALYTAKRSGRNIVSRFDYGPRES